MLERERTESIAATRGILRANLCSIWCGSHMVKPMTWVAGAVFVALAVREWRLCRRAGLERIRRPAPPLAMEDLIGRVYLGVGMVVLGLFAAVMCRGCL